MAVSINGLTDALVKAFTETRTVTSYDSQTGTPTEKKEKFEPEREKMKKMATEILNHLTDNVEVYDVATRVDTVVSTTVAPGIPITNAAGPGATTAPGAGSGSGSGTGSQTGTGRMK